jgi:hypothetical protein
VVVGAAVGAGAGYVVLHDGDEEPSLPSARQAAPDTAPAEFAYLDSARVLAYLGQIEGGLAASQTRTVSAKTTTKLSLTPKQIAAEASSERQRASSETVTPKQADRFYTLLRILRADQATGSESAFKTLTDIDVKVTSKNTTELIRGIVRGLDEGEFVRIRNAHVSTPKFAGVLRRVSFASYYRGAALDLPRQKLYASLDPALRPAVQAYEKRLKKRNARVPIIVPTTDAAGDPVSDGGVTFLMPARYLSFGREASLLEGEMTIVGKIVYWSMATPYFDRATLGAFLPALRHANVDLLELLDLSGDVVTTLRTKWLTIEPPVAVVIPMAMYQ